MTIEVAPTLELMAQVYRQPTVGGPESERFRSYVAAAHEGAPVHGYNPMTSKPVLPAIEALLEVRAEERLHVVANETVRRLGDDVDDVMHLTVATPGMWTDQLATEVEHRLLAKDPAGVLWWFDAPVDVHALDAAIVAQTVRLGLQRDSGPPATLAAAVRQEGLAGAMAGGSGRRDGVAADVLELLGDDTGLATMTAFLFGDRAAEAMGYTPLGLADRVGCEHAIAIAAAAT